MCECVADPPVVPYVSEPIGYLLSSAETLVHPLGVDVSEIMIKLFNVVNLLLEHTGVLKYGGVESAVEYVPVTVCVWNGSARQ